MLSDIIKFFPLDIGAAILGGISQALFDRIMPRRLPYTEHEVDSELNKWRTKLAMIQSVVGDAEEKQWTNMAVKVWLDDLRDFAYDLEDMLNEYATKILERQQTASPDEIISFIKEQFKNLLNNFRTMSDCGVMSDRLEELSGRIRLLQLMERTVGRTTSTALRQRPASTCVQAKSTIYGREEDRRRIFEMMSRDESSGSANFRVISIVGMAGVGKTALAQSVYNPQSVGNDSQIMDFDRRVWVCISHDFDVFRISMAILESITSSSHDLKSLNEVQVQLQNKVAGKRFLFVFDDVWSNNYDLWETLKSPFLTGARGSVIIVTTRSIDVALAVGGLGDYYDLKLLSDDDCWSVFKMHAFGDIVEHSNIEAVREKVVTKCGGLPLAARTLGGLLRSNERNYKWEDILNSKIWDLPEENNILSVLKLSYYHLPAHLKRCLAYCAVLPKNYEFEKKELVLLWIAEGLILPSANNKQLEDVGSEYFHDLLSRSIFQKSSGNTSKFVMHNLINDLAEWIMGEIVFKLEDESEANKQAERFLRVRHFSYEGNDFDGKSKVEVLKSVKNLRTILSVITRNGDYPIENTDLIDLLSKFKKLRVLSLRKYRIRELPDDSFKSLRYLRYLNLSETLITCLPPSLEKLYNLQILLLTNCTLLVELPCFMGDLVRLIHLDISGACRIGEMPTGMENLKYLQTLSDFIVSSRSSLKALKNMKFLGGELRISSLQNVNNLDELKLCILNDKKNLLVLILDWESRPGNSRRDEELEKEVLDLLRPHKNLTKLTIKHYGGIDFPYWVGDPSFSNIVDLTIQGCERCTSLPPLGLLGSLKYLIIRKMTSLVAIRSTFYGEGCLKPFPSLETLHLENLAEWKTWETIDDKVNVNIFLCLHELSIINCPKLSRTLPKRLPSLQKLVIRQCAALLVSRLSFPELCKLEIHETEGGLGNTPAADSLPVNSIPLANNSDGQNSSTDAIRRVGQPKAESFLHLSTFLDMSSLSSLISLEIKACGGLTSLQAVMEQSAYLRRLKIESCDSLEFIVRGKLPFSLKRLEIHKCENLQSVLEITDHIKLSLLEQLCISDCKSLTTLVSRGQLSETLKWLKIKNCVALNTLSSEGQLLPVSLEHLDINQCGIYSIPIGRHNLGSLREIEVFCCSNLRGFPQDGLPFTSLRKFSVSYCQNLDALPSSMHSFKSLQELQVFECSRSIEFQPSGLPISLTSLRIEGVALYSSLAKWGLHRLNSLQKLDIIGPIAGSNEITFPRPGSVLPASLNYLSLANFTKLTFLEPQGFQNLASLEYFTISNCRKTLGNFPGVLPSSLLKLEIIGCPRLARSVRTTEGQRRANIADIPFVMIDCVSI